MTSTRELIDQLPAIPRESDGPVFSEPWEATAFALAVELHRRGHFTWNEWAHALAAEIKRANDSGQPDLGDTYYQHWLSALEQLTTDKGLADPHRLSERREAWRDAYINTPHGKPVSLKKQGGRLRRLHAR